MDTLSIDDINSISLSSLAETATTPITNSGLSEEAITELCADVTSEGTIELLQVYINGEWHNFCNKKIDVKGTDDDGRPVYYLTYGNQEWLYLPFEFALDSSNSSGEIIGGSISISNSSVDIAQVLDSAEEAIPIKRLVLSLKTRELLVEDSNKYLVAVVNDGLTISGETKPMDILNELCPSESYSSYYYKI